MGIGQFPSFKELFNAKAFQALPINSAVGVGMPHMNMYLHHSQLDEKMCCTAHVHGGRSRQFGNLLELVGVPDQ